MPQMMVSGECADVQEERVTWWHERMKVIMTGYGPEYVWNTDETGCFFPSSSRQDLSRHEGGISRW